MGGDGLNLGCIPSKTIISSSRVSEEIKEASGHGVRVFCGAEADFAAVMKRMRRLRAKISRHDSVLRLKDMGIDVFLGEGRFTGPDSVYAAGKALRFQKAVIATGARPFHPPIKGLAAAGYLTSETVFSLVKRPARMAVLGGGSTGCELAQAFQRLGTQVVLLHNKARLMDKEDPEASAILQGVLSREGMRIILGGWAIKHVEVTGTEKVLHIKQDSVNDQFTVDEIFVAAGRTPNVESLGLEAADVAYDARAGVQVDNFLRTSNRRIYAAGDVCLNLRFNHTAEASSKIAVQNALLANRKRFDLLTIPWCTFTDPEVAHVGMYEHEALSRGIEVETLTEHLDNVDRAVLEGEDEGFVKVHIRKGPGAVLGATIVSKHAGEMIGLLTLAMTAGIGLAQLSHLIHPYPTRSEAIGHIADRFASSLSKARQEAIAKRFASGRH
jgi:pyruvate/2-oxoglutarate dehydrogenase complex dihydrolipoamide dehydrogenase (E3) component